MGGEEGLIPIYWQEKGIALLQTAFGKAKHENVCFWKLTSCKVWNFAKNKADLCTAPDYYIAKFPDCRLDAAALAAQSKSSEDIIKSSKFPAAHAPAPNEIPKIETEHWPGPPSLAAIGMQTQTLHLCGSEGPGDQGTPTVLLENRVGKVVPTADAHHKVQFSWWGHWVSASETVELHWVEEDLLKDFGIGHTDINP